MGSIYYGYIVSLPQEAIVSRKYPKFLQEKDPMDKSGIFTDSEVLHTVAEGEYTTGFIFTHQQCERR